MRSLARSSLLPFILVCACGPSPKPVEPPKPPPPPPAKVTPQGETPSRWVIRESELHGKFDLGKEGVLYIGRGGERWLDTKAAGAKPTHAQTFVPEDIATFTKGADGSYLFVGTSGTVYPATTPLGALGPKRVANPPLTSVSAGKGAIVGVQRGQMVRSTDGGVTWNKVAMPNNVGSVVAVALVQSGNGLALMAPQRVFVTNDDGATFQPITSPGIGARSLATGYGFPYLQGDAGWAVLKSGPNRFEKVGLAPAESYDIEFPGVQAAGYAQATLIGTGVLTGDKYYEAVANWDTNELEVYAEELGKPTTSNKIKTVKDCTNARLGGHENLLVLACSKYDEEAGFEKYTLWKSDDGGKSWKDDGEVASAGRTDERIWVAPNGTVYFKGACTIPRSDDCDGHGIVRPAGGKWQDAVVDGSGASFYHLAFSPNGNTVFAVGTAGDPDEGGRPAALFISRNGGKDFTRKKLPINPMDAVESDPTIAYTRRRGALAIDDSGLLVGAAIAYEGHWFGFTTKDDGETMTQQSLPPTDGVAFAGRRGYAHAPGGKGYETFDGGATWTRVNAIDDEDTNLACSPRGCMLGRRSIRMGWDLTAPGGSWEKEPPKTKKTVFRKPWTCNPEGDWLSLGPRTDASSLNVDLAGNRFAIPVVDEKKRLGKVVLGNVSTKPAKPPAAGSKAPNTAIETKEVVLFDLPDNPKEDLRTVTMTSMGGVAVLRWMVPAAPKPPTTPPGKPPIKPSPASSAKPATSAKPPPAASAKPPGVGPASTPTPKGPPMPVKSSIPTKAPGKTTPDAPKVDVGPYGAQTVDITWWSAATNKVYKATVKDVPAKFNYTLYSITPGGIHFAATQSYQNASQLFFVSEAGKVERLGYPGKPTDYYSVRDAVRVGNRSVFITQNWNQQVTTWWSKEGGAWETRTWGVWPKPYEPQSAAAIGRALIGGVPSITIAWPGSPALAPVGWSIPLKAPEVDPTEVLPLPTQASLGETEKACGKDAATWSRVILPYSKGSRHPIKANIDGSPRNLATNEAVLHVSPAGDACLAAFGTTRFYATATYDMTIDPSDQAHAFVWKREKGELSVKTAACTPSNDELPAYFKETDGFSE